VKRSEQSIAIARSLACGLSPLCRLACRPGLEPDDTRKRENPLRFFLLHIRGQFGDSKKTLLLDEFCAAECGSAETSRNDDKEG
jgi:hypothetical protein